MQVWLPAFLLSTSHKAPRLHLAPAAGSLWSIMAACAAVRAECMARAFRDVYVPSQSCLQSYAELFDSLQHRLASVYLSQFPTGFLHIIRAARSEEGNSSVLHLNYNINKQGKGSKNTENDWLNHRCRLVWNYLMLQDQWQHDWLVQCFDPIFAFRNYGKVVKSDKFGFIRLKLCLAINVDLIAKVYCWIWRRCWSWLIFRQGSGLFCRTLQEAVFLFFFFNFSPKC